MTELLTAAQMRAIEQAAIDSGEVTGLELMERAGRGVVEAIFEEWPELAATSHRAVVLCGPGNNGGDGFVVARLLKAWGWEVEVFLYGDAGKLPPDAKVNYERWGELGEVMALTDDAIEGYGEDNPDTALAIDAVFGTGLKRPFHDIGSVQIELNYWQAASRYGSLPKVVSVDIPSGLCADSGQYLGYGPNDENPLDLCVLSNLTVSFHSEKTGHRLFLGPKACGKTAVSDIGLPGSDRPRGGVKRPPGGAVGRCPAVPPGEIVELIDAPRGFGLGKADLQHKYTHGHALILSGPSGKGGAGRLAARGALRIGAGLVTVGCPPDALAENAAQLNAIMLVAVHDGDALARVLEDSRINALCLGPGLGLERAKELVTAALAPTKEVRPDRGGAQNASALGGGSGASRIAGDPGRAVVLDADALTAFADDPGTLFALLHENCVLTPHAGEFARLFPDIAEKLNATPTKGPAYSKVDATRAAAARASCVVLFKGPDTVIADPSGRCAINSAAYERAAPWLATAGAGDVLAGMISGLLARGSAPMQAAETAAWLHVECARSFGPGLIAEDLPEELPKVFRALGI